MIVSLINLVGVDANFLSELSQSTDLVKCGQWPEEFSSCLYRASSIKNYTLYFMTFKNGSQWLISSSLQDSMIFYYIFDCNYKSVSNSQCRLFGNLLCSLNLLIFFPLISLLIVRFCLSDWCHNGVNLWGILSPSACLYTVWWLPRFV